NKRPAIQPLAGPARYAFSHVSEKASIAVEIVWPAISRGTGLPGRRRPLTTIEASSQPTNRLGIVCAPVADLSGGSAKQNGLPSPRQVRVTSMAPAFTVSL